MKTYTYTENDTDVNNLELLRNIAITNPLSIGRKLNQKAKKYKFLVDWILEKTKHLTDKNIKMPTRVYWIINDIQEFPKCQNCGNDLPISLNVASVTRGYDIKTCCKECQYEFSVKNSKKTCLERYGVEYSFQSENNKEKSKQTCIKKYGVESAMQSKQISDKMVKSRLENNNGVYITEEQYQKGVQTSLKRFGVEHYQSTDEFKQKRREDSLKKYGVDYPSKDPNVKRKTVETRLKNGNGKYMTDEQIQKSEETCMKHYGVRNAFCAGSPFRDKADQTKLEKYGDKNYNNREQAEKTCLERYGVSNVANVFRQESSHTKTTHNYNNLLTNKYVVPIFSLDDYLNKEKDTIFKWKCLECGNEFEAPINWNTRYCCDDNEIVLGRCLNCHPLTIDSRTSKEEQQFISDIRSIYTGKIEERCYILEYGQSKRNWLQIDCYLPDLNIGFEYDGIYFHALSSETDESERNLLKTELAEKQGIKLVHVRSDQWLNDRDRYLQLYKDIIDDTVDFSKIYDLNQQTIEVDRCTFNKCFNVPGYNLIGEKPPKVITIVTPSRNYIYKECGHLIYKKKIDVHYI